MYSCGPKVEISSSNVNLTIGSKVVQIKLLMDIVNYVYEY